MNDEKLLNMLTSCDPEMLLLAAVTLAELPFSEVSRLFHNYGYCDNDDIYSIKSKAKTGFFNCLFEFRDYFINIMDGEIVLSENSIRLSCSEKTLEWLKWDEDQNRYWSYDKGKNDK